LPYGQNSSWLHIGYNGVEIALDRVVLEMQGAEIAFGGTTLTPFDQNSPIGAEMAFKILGLIWLFGVESALLKLQCRSQSESKI